MSSRWFRVYEDLVDDPKVQRLPLPVFRALINLWCLASGNGGELPDISIIAFKLRMSEGSAKEIIETLRTTGLVDGDETLRPHNWNGRQFKTDVSTERVKQFRKRRRNVSPNVSETSPETETETETETEISAAVVDRGMARDRFEVELRDALGARSPPEDADFSPILALIKAGYDPVKDILPIARSRAAKATETIGSWRYFVPAVEAITSANAAIMPKANGKPSAPMTWLVQDDPRWSKIAERYQQERTKPLLAGGSSHATGIGAFVPSAWLIPPADFSDLEIPEALRRT